MKKTITKFSCDNCNKELTKVRNNNERDFPWDEGWLELNSIDLGIPKINARLNEQPAHIQLETKEFCSKDCMLHFLNRQIMDVSVKVEAPVDDLKNIGVKFDNEYEMYGAEEINLQKPHFHQPPFQHQKQQPIFEQPPQPPRQEQQREREYYSEVRDPRMMRDPRELPFDMPPRTMSAEELEKQFNVRPQPPRLNPNDKLEEVKDPLTPPKKKGFPFFR